MFYGINDHIKFYTFIQLQIMVNVILIFCDYNLRN